MVCNRSTSTLLAYSVISSWLRILLCTVIAMIDSALASAFDTTGGASRSFGSEREASETLSRTSLAAASRSMLRSNSTLILLLPWLLIEVMFLIPAMPLMAFSSGSVICDSMISALAPG